MNTQHLVLTTPVIATADITSRRFVGFDGNFPAAGARPLGVAEIPADADSPVAVNVLGIMLVEAGAAITAGAEVQTDANGCAIALASGTIAGVALDAAAAAGELIRIVRGI